MATTATTTGANYGTTEPSIPPPPTAPPPVTGAGATGATGTTGAYTGADTSGGAYRTTTGGTTSERVKTEVKSLFRPGRGLEAKYNVPLALFAILVPPLAVFLKVGFFGPDFWINILLTILAWFPGVLHAWYVIFTRAGGGVSGRTMDTGTGTTYKAA